MKLPDHFIQEVADRTDIEELVGRYVTLKRTGANLVGLCPFHSEKTPSFSVTPSKNMFYCFGCHAGGSAITFAQKIENLDFADAVIFLADRAGIPVPQESTYTVEKETVSRKRVLEMNLEAAKFFRACLFDPAYGADGMKYLREERGLSDATIKHFGLGFAPDQFGLLTTYMQKRGYRDEELQAAFLCGKSQKTGKPYDYFRNRVIFPIIDTSGNVVAFGGRVMDDSKPKYLNTSDTPAFKKSNHLFALNFAKNDCAEEMILCEGYMDVIALHAAGFSNAVATLGTAINQSHARIFSKYTKKVFISYDADEAGQNAAKKAMHILGEVGLDVRVLKVPGAKDPDEFIRKFGADRFRRVLQDSKTGFEHQSDAILGKYDLTIGSDKIRASGELCALIAGYPSPIEREVYLAEASKKLGLPQDVLKNSTEKIRNRQISEQKNRERRDAQSAARRFGDRIDPDAAKEPRAAAAEESVLGLLMIYDEYRAAVFAGDIPLTEDDFQTGFHRRVFKKIMEMQGSPGEYRFELFGSEFDPDETGRIRQMEVRRQMLTENGPEVFRSAIGTMREIAEEKKTEDGDIRDRIEFLRNKKLHKGKDERT